MIELRTSMAMAGARLDPEQLNLALKDIEQALAASEAEDDRKDEAGARAEKRRVNRGTLPAHLPRVCI
jgi:hypothetical protein